MDENIIICQIIQNNIVAAVDITPPSNVSNLAAGASDGQIVLNWTDPADADFSHVDITWIPGGATVRQVAAGAGTYTATGLTNETVYIFIVKSVDTSGNVSIGITTTGTTDGTAPSEVSGLAAAAGNGQIVLNWTDPTDADFSHAEITWSPGGATVRQVAAGAGSYTATGLTNGTLYTFTIKSVDTSGNVSIGTTTTGTPDRTAPSEVSGFAATPGNGQIALNWTDPADLDFDHVEITWSPDGATVRQAVAGAGTYTATGLTNETLYTFTIKSVDSAGNVSIGTTTTGTPDGTAPSEVSGLAAIADNGRIFLNWTDPADADFDHVEITWSPDGLTAQQVAAGAGTYTANGLTNGTFYAFTVKCVDSAGNVSTGTTISYAPRPAGNQSILSIGGVIFKMRYVPGKTFFTGTSDAGSATVSHGYWMTETEGTYELWNAVKTWGTSNGYTFANAGLMGDGTGDTNKHPVTTINWRDAMVWMNALTEYYNAEKGTSLECVYTSDAAYTTCLRTSTNNAAISYGSLGSEDDPYVNPSAKGFRLPTSNEWELAARYINDDNGDGDITDAGEYYPGNHISGDTTNPWDTSSLFGDYGWYSGNSSSSTNIVATKSVNALGLFDMSGNVWELNFDWHPDWPGTKRVIRGGSWLNTESSMQVGLAVGLNPVISSDTVGFRFSMSAP